VGRIEVREVASNGDLMKFIKLPNALYKNEKHHVPYLIPDRKKFLDKKKNPFFQHARAAYYLAFQSGRPVGRIAGIVNDLHNEYHNEKTGFFGFFDCIDDYDIAKALLDTAEEFARKEGMNLIRGPMNFSTNDEIGLLIEGFDMPPMFMMTWNPPYYIGLYERLGLSKIEDVFAYYIDDKNPQQERIVIIVEKIRARSRIRIRKLDLGDFQNELERIRKIYNDAWSDNWGFVPMTPEEFQHTADDFRKLVEPELVLLAFIDDEPAGFSLTMPDYNQVFKKMNGRLFPFGLLKFVYYTKFKKIITGARIITMGIMHKYQKIGLDMVLSYDTFIRGPQIGYHWGEMSWILERNVLMNRAAETLGGKKYKTYRIFEKAI
jgi:hypothetical protein